MSILELVEDMALIVADFASEYGVRLAVEPMTWREFISLLNGLLSKRETRLYGRVERKQRED